MSDGALLMAAALLLALLMDGAFGEPPAWMHPVVGMGKYLSWCGKLLPGLRPPLAFGSGALAWLAGAALAGGLAWFAQQQMVFSLHPVIAAVFMAVLLKPMLAWRMLRSEVDAVEAALQQSLEAGRERLSWLVSRNTVLLNESEVRESAIESLAENLNDSVVAPIFWFVLFGLPGAAIYRFANTADAMWGYRGIYKGKNWEWAGKWAARADDVLSWIPARLTALLLALVAGSLTFKNLETLRREAGKTPSPNSGWPMAAMALALGVSLRKPGVYTLNPGGKPPQARDTVLAQNYASKVVLALFVLMASALILIALARPWS